MKFIKLFILLTILLVLPVTILASKSEIKAPENGKLNTYKDDFECNRGYKKNLENWSCNEIKLPESGVLTVAGNDWSCIANYTRVGVKCEKLQLPENANFFVQGPAWYCNFGYQKQDDKCIKLVIPSNAHWSYDGNDWECNKGFTESEDGKSCIEVKISENAQSNYIETFNCNSGFKKESDKCVKVSDIENGKFYTIGAEFYCNNGYRRNESERKCDRIKIPENAHEDNLALDGWSCNKEYTKEGSECKKFNLPENADWVGEIWKCKLGYRKNPTNGSCNKISLPENAHYTNTYDGWLCNNGYTKNYKENRCDRTP
jgi:hypothetical protein